MQVLLDRETAICLKWKSAPNDSEDTLGDVVRNRLRLN